MCDPTVSGRMSKEKFSVTALSLCCSNIQILYLYLTFAQSSDESQPFSYLQAIWKVAAHTLCNAQNPGDLILIL